jgi:large subunit ribosomal protein L13
MGPERANRPPLSYRVSSLFSAVIPDRNNNAHPAAIKVKGSSACPGERGSKSQGKEPTLCLARKRRGGKERKDFLDFPKRYKPPVEGTIASGVRGVSEQAHTHTRKMSYKVTGGLRNIRNVAVEGLRYRLVDARGEVVGRLASKLSLILQGKDKPTYKPWVANGDVVVVVNAAEVTLTGRKLENKKYYRHTGYVGNLVTRTAKEMMEREPTFVLRKAVERMLPKNKVGLALFNHFQFSPLFYTAKTHTDRHLMTHKQTLDDSL